MPHESKQETTQGQGSLVVLTGAGASKVCGLPDMWEFARLLHQTINHSNPTDVEMNMVNRLLYGTHKGIPPSDRKQSNLETDLEGFLAALLMLKDGASCSDPAIRMLTSLIQELTSAQTDTMEQLTKSGTHLADQLSGVKGDVGISWQGPDTIPDTPIVLSSEVPLESSHTAGNYILATGTTGGYHLQGTGDVGALAGAVSARELSSELRNAKKGADKQKQYVDQLPKFSTALLERAKDLILETYSKASPETVKKQYEPAYAIMQKYARGTLDFFTLNYDPTIEIFGQLANVEILTGFVADGREWVWQNHFDPPSPQERPRIKLHKLHGSVTWFSYDSKIIEVSVGFGQKNLPTLIGKPAQNIVIYPALSKDTYSEPYVSLMDRFRTSLRIASCCLVVGCSYRDEQVVSLLGHMTKENGNLKIIQCGMSEDKVKSKPHLKSLTPKMRFMKTRFGDAGFPAELDAVLAELCPRRE